MSIHKDDRFLWFAVGIGLFFAYRGIVDQLFQVRKLTEINQKESPGKKLDQDTEDAVSLDTLDALTKSHNHELRAASIHIICDRFLRGQAIKNLYADLAGPNPSKRDDALTATLFLLSSGALTESRLQDRIQESFHNPEFLKALTRCLIRLLPEHQKPKGRRLKTSYEPSAIATNSPVRPPNRPRAETKALQILCKILPSTKHAALTTGLISDWLAQYPFPCALPENGSRRDLVLKLFQTWNWDDRLMHNVLSVFQSFLMGQRALAQAGYPPHYHFNDETEDEYPDETSYGDIDGDVVMHGGEDTAGAPSSEASPPRRVRRRRLPADSAEEQAIRRRRREAMVISDGGGPIGQDNIIQREETQRPSPPVRSNTDEQLEILEEEVDRELNAELEGAPILDDRQLEERLQ